MDYRQLGGTGLMVRALEAPYVPHAVVGFS